MGPWIGRGYLEENNQISLTDIFMKLKSFRVRCQIRSTGKSTEERRERQVQENVKNLHRIGKLS